MHAHTRIQSIRNELRSDLPIVENTNGSRLRWLRALSNGTHVAISLLLSSWSQDLQRLSTAENLPPSLRQHTFGGPVKSRTDSIRYLGNAWPRETPCPKTHQRTSEARCGGVNAVVAELPTTRVRDVIVVFNTVTRAAWNGKWGGRQYASSSRLCCTRYVCTITRSCSKTRTTRSDR